MLSDLTMMFGEAILDSIVMTAISSGFAYLLGIPLGVLLVIWDRDGLSPKPALHKVLSYSINLIRSIPFLLLLVAIQSFTRVLVGTTVGTKAIIVPLTLASAPYIARVVESSLREVSPGVIEAARSMGASDFQVITKVLLKESGPSLLVNGAIAVTTILGYSAMAGFVGAGGLGAVAVNYGYYRYDQGIMWIAILLLVLMVQLIQGFGNRLVRKTDHRIHA